MDKKSISIVVVCVILLLFWNTLFGPKRSNLPVSQGTNAPIAGTVVNGANNTNPVPTVGREPVISSLAAPQFPKPDAAEQTLNLDTKDARFTFTSYGGGLKLVELKGFPDSISCGPNRKSTAPDTLASLNTRAPVSALTLLGGSALYGDGLFTLTRTATGVHAEKILPSGLAIIKTFEPGSNDLINVTLRIENRTAAPMRIPAQDWIIGTATPISPHDNGLLNGVQLFNGTKLEAFGDSWFQNRTLGCIPGTPRTDLITGSSNVVWASVHNQFFAIVAIPKDPAYQLHAQKIELPGPTLDQIKADPKAVQRPSGFQAGLLYPETVLAAGQTIERKLELFAGPKEYNTLRKLGRKLELVMDFGGFFGWFAQILLFSLNGLHGVGLSYGLAIILITVIIKTAFWPLTTASTRSMKRMAELQPQMKAIQEKYKSDPTKMNQKLMAFMKENKVNPMGGCLPMLLQIPVFFGFFTMLRSAIELRGATFLWACDLSQADTVYIIPGLNFPVNPFPILMGISMLWQARLTPPSPGVDPMQQKMMQYMPLMMVVFLYNYSAGLTLYWTVQNLLSILQMKVTKSRAPGDKGPKKGGSMPPMPAIAN